MWQPVNCVPILTPPPPLHVCMPISFPVMLPWSKQHFGKNNQGEWDGVHHAARRLTSDGQSLSKTPPVSSLCLSSSLCLIISSLGGTWGVGWAWFGLWNQAGNRCLGCLGSGVYDYCWDKHTFYMAFFWHTNPMMKSLHVGSCCSRSPCWVTKRTCKLWWTSIWLLTDCFTGILCWAYWTSTWLEWQNCVICVIDIYHKLYRCRH